MTASPGFPPQPGLALRFLSCCQGRVVVFCALVGGKWVTKDPPTEPFPLSSGWGPGGGSLSGAAHGWALLPRTRRAAAPGAASPPPPPRSPPPARSPPAPSLPEEPRLGQDTVRGLTVGFGETWACRSLTCRWNGKRGGRAKEGSCRDQPASVGTGPCADVAESDQHQRQGPAVFPDGGRPRVPGPALGEKATSALEGSDWGSAKATSLTRRLRRAVPAAWPHGGGGGGGQPRVLRPAPRAPWRGRGGTQPQPGSVREPSEGTLCAPLAVGAAESRGWQLRPHPVPTVLPPASQWGWPASSRPHTVSLRSLGPVTGPGTVVLALSAPLAPEAPEECSQSPGSRTAPPPPCVLVRPLCGPVFAH